MDAPVSNSLRITFLVFLIVTVVMGVALILVPGRTLVVIGWLPNDVQINTPDGVVIVPGTTMVNPPITRLLGAALLTLGYASLLGWRASRREQVRQLVQIEFVYCVLGLVVLAIYLFQRGGSLSVAAWVMAAILAAFAVAWGLALRR